MATYKTSDNKPASEPVEKDDKDHEWQITVTVQPTTFTFKETDSDLFGDRLTDREAETLNADSDAMVERIFVDYIGFERQGPTALEILNLFVYEWGYVNDADVGLDLTLSISLAD